MSQLLILGCPVDRFRVQQNPVSTHASLPCYGLACPRQCFVSLA